jgi:hypothetical protein
MEKRSLIRNCIRVAVVCSSLTTRIPAEVSTGTLLNCSYGGVCIELDRRIRIGSIVLIKVIGKGSNEAHRVSPDGFRTLALAEVKWTKPLDDTKIYNYAIGLRYLSI